MIILLRRKKYLKNKLKNPRKTVHVGNAEMYIWGVGEKEMYIFTRGLCKKHNVLSARARAPVAHSKDKWERDLLVSMNEVYFWSAQRRFHWETLEAS